LERENAQLQNALREANTELKNANRQINELTALKAQLEAERDNLASALRDTEEALRDAEAKLAAAQAALNQLRAEMEQRLREKDEEIDSIRFVSINVYFNISRSLFVLFPLAVVLSVLLRFTDSDYPFGIFKLFLKIYIDHNGRNFHLLENMS
jgi:uncharacterized protein involved in exopolysaccharide biosynthesis